MGDTDGGEERVRGGALALSLSPGLIRLPRSELNYSTSEAAVAMMLGRKVWYGVACTCCNGPRSVRVEKVREKRLVARELRPEGLLPTALDDPSDCSHGCNGDCVESGSDTCGFWCHRTC